MSAPLSAGGDEKVNEHNARVPRDHWLEEWEEQAIVKFHGQYPLEGYRRLAFMMLDRDLVATSPSMVIGAQMGPTQGCEFLYDIGMQNGPTGAFKPSSKAEGNVELREDRVAIGIYDFLGTEDPRRAPRARVRDVPLLVI